MKAIQSDHHLHLQVVATGMHLSPEFGLTYKVIENDGFHIDEKVELLLSSDSPSSVCKSIGLGCIGFTEAFARIRPDIVVGLGDRYEFFSAVISAMVLRIPVAHIHGGEATEGLIDEAIRHSITKMSHLHFTATEDYRKRVVQLGEHPRTVFNFGAMGIDNIKALRLLTKREFEARIGRRLKRKNILIAFHPVTLEDDTAGKQFRELISALDEIPASLLVFTKPNADTYGRAIIRLIDDYVSTHQSKAVSFVSMGQRLFLSALRWVDVIVGNSSSGIIEMPSFGKGTINIGDRQRGRVKAPSVIDCAPRKESILKAMDILESTEFQKRLKSVRNPYGEGGASKKIMKVLKDYELKGIVKKSFHDIEFEP
jgi:GDP/UDP-N,N'-diacetylbacillosamine 2-epimerase (hydrolysing)